MQSVIENGDADILVAERLSQEREPLLRPQSPSGQPLGTYLIEQPRTVPGRMQRRATILIYVLTFTIEVPLILLLTSEARIFELILCKQYYEVNDPSRIGPNGRVLEKYCKVDDVQAKVASLRGGQQFFQNLPCTFHAMKNRRLCC